MDAVDCAMDALSGNTVAGHPWLRRRGAEHTDRDTGLTIDAVREISNYWEEVRGQYAAFETGMQAPASEVYLHEMPGGQFTNLKAQAALDGAGRTLARGRQTYADVNQMFGDIVKVTPSSKVVGDHGADDGRPRLTRAQVEDPEPDVVLSRHVIDMMRGNLGQPPGGFPQASSRRSSRAKSPSPNAPAAICRNVIWRQPAKPAKQLEGQGRRRGSERLSDVSQGFPRLHGPPPTYGPVRTCRHARSFTAWKPGEEITAEIDPGVTLEIRCQAIGETNDQGEVRVFFELNGQPRTVRVPNRKVTGTTQARPKADAGNDNHIGAPMPGVVATVAVAAGQKVKEGDLLLTIEAMKMETGLHAERNATVKAVHVAAGGQIDAKDLLVELE